MVKKWYIGSDGKTHNGGISDLKYSELMELHKIKIEFTHKKKRSILRNCVDYRIGKYILDCVTSVKKQQFLF